MDNQNEKKYSIYIQHSRAYVEVSEEFYKKYHADLDPYRQKQQRGGYCRCPRKELWRCDGACPECRFQCRPDGLLSLDYELQGVEGDQLPIIATVQDPGMPLEERLEKKELLNAFRQAVSMLSEEDRLICRMIAYRISQREMASILGLKSQSSVSDRKRKVLDELRESLKDYA